MERGYGKLEVYVWQAVMLIEFSRAGERMAYFKAVNETLRDRVQKVGRNTSARRVL